MNTGRWPFKGDSPAAAARKVALAYRAIAEDAMKRLADAGVDVGDIESVVDLDSRFRQWGQHWVSPHPAQYDPDDLIPAEIAGPLIGLAAGSITTARLRNRIAGVRDGKRFLYRVSDVYALSSDVRRRQDMRQLE